MSADEFISSFSLIMNLERNEMVSLFLKIDTDLDGIISWDDFSSYMLLRAEGEKVNSPWFMRYRSWRRNRNRSFFSLIQQSFIVYHWLRSTRYRSLLIPWFPGFDWKNCLCTVIETLHHCRERRNNLLLVWATQVYPQVSSRRVSCSIITISTSGIQGELIRKQNNWVHGILSPTIHRLQIFVQHKQNCYICRRQLYRFSWLWNCKVRRQVKYRRPSPFIDRLILR